MKLNRKLKKKVIKIFGIGTYKGIITGYIGINTYKNNRGVVTVRTEKPMGDKFGESWFHVNQFNPYIILKKIKYK